MLVDPKEIAIVSKAKQKNVRDPRRSREHFFNIIADFFDGVTLNGRYVDLGPGQFDLAEIIRQQGGSCVGVDFDPAVVELGRYKGLDVVQLDIRRLADHDFGERFDGLFNKFTLNAFWHWSDDTEHERLVRTLADLVKPDGWAWIGPWNGIPKNSDLDESTIRRVLDFQSRCFEALGFQTTCLSEQQTRRYGIHGVVANHVVVTRNLNWRPKQ